MAFPKYESYKDSGIEWLGEIPSHWDLTRLKTAIKSSTNGIWGNDPDENNEDDGIVCIRVADFSRYNLLVSLEKLTRRRISDSEFQSRKLLPGDLLLEKSGGGDNQLVGQVVLFEHDIPAVCSNFLARLRIRDDFSSRFLNYVNACLYFLKINYKHIKQTTGIQNIDSNSYLAEFFAFPTLEEQRRIADFLDRKTSEIDQAIAQKQRLIELLQEQKAILINQAVTKGLNPNAPMCDSGVQWLGEIPEHWEVWRSKRLFSQRKEFAQSDDIQLSATQAYGVIPQEEYENRIGRKVTKVFQHLEKRRHVEVGDFVISMRSFQGGLERAWAKGCIRSSYVVLKPSAQVDIDFFSYVFKSQAYISALQTTANFIRDGQDLNFDNFCAIDLVLPPIEKQRATAQALNVAVADNAKIAEQAQKEIDLLREFRQIVIANAVTGKMKV